jgi:hypothetical protein
VPDTSSKKGGRKRQELEVEEPEIEEPKAKKATPAAASSPTAAAGLSTEHKVCDARVRRQIEDCFMLYDLS